MTGQEKRELVRLLWKYQMELMEVDEKNSGVEYFYRICGVKAQFNHARCIANRLSCEVGQDIL
jgi:hypothetical protein|nr:MAG TPA: hypothetical protein [Caudoviricetes sp.]